MIDCVENFACHILWKEAAAKDKKKMAKRNGKVFYQIYNSNKYKYANISKGNVDMSRS